MVFSGRNLSLAARFNSFVEALPNPFSCPNWFDSFHYMSWIGTAFYVSQTVVQAWPFQGALPRRDCGIPLSELEAYSVRDQLVGGKTWLLHKHSFFCIISRSNAAGVTEDVVDPLQKVGLSQYCHVVLGCPKLKMHR